MKQINYVSSKINPQTAWDRLSLAEQAEMMKVAVSKGYTNLYDIKDKYNEFASGGEIEEELPPATPFGQRVEVVITPDQEYNQYLNTLPDNQRFTPNDRYDSYLYWKLNGKPKNFQEAYQKGMFHFDHSDNAYHANSIAFGNDGVGYFMKPKTHDTVGFETDWYNHGIVTEEGGIRRPVNEEERRELEEFRRNYKLADDPDRSGYFMYVPIQKSFGGNLQGPIVETAMNEYKDGGGIHIKPSHRGRLTELKARTGKSEAELYNDGNPAHKKMVVFARNARKWHGFGGNLFYPGGEITYGKPFYSYDENGQKIDNTLNYNATIPEIVIIPDSRKTPAQRNEDERFRQRSLKGYDEDKSKEFTAKQVLQSQKDWEKSFEKQALDYAQAAAAGVGIGADIVSGLPIYSSLKGASVLSRAETPMDYVEGSLWLTPLFGEAYQTAKPMVTTAVNDILTNYPALYQYPRYAIGKLKYGMDVELPTVYRKVSNLPKVENGRVVISNPNNRFAYDNGFGEESPIITNFSTDAPVRSHSAGNWDRDLTLAFPGKTLLGKNVISTQPSDTFVFGDNITVPIKDVTGFSGRQKELNYLGVNGIKSVTSPEAEVFWESGASDLMSKIAQARATNAKIFQNRGKGVVLLKPKTPSGDFGNYANTIENLTRETFRSPTLKDYQFMDYVFKPKFTSEVTPKADNFTFGFVNKNPIFGEWLGNSERRTYLEQPWRWKNVMYDPLTPIESDFRDELNIGLKPKFKR